MKTIILAVLALAAVPAALVAAPPADNKAIVTAFYEAAFVKHQPTMAARAYLSDHYIQHNPHVPNGVAPLIGYFEQYFRTHPTASSRIYRVIAEGDLVVIHSHAKENPRDVGQALIDIFRVDHGRIVEHWDVMQPVVAKTPNGNTMFDGDNAK